MADLLIRNLEAETVNRLKRRARSHNRSLQGEVKLILEQEAAREEAAAWDLADRIRASFRGRAFSDSAALVREDRDR